MGSNNSSVVDQEGDVIMERANFLANPNADGENHIGTMSSQTLYDPELPPGTFDALAGSEMDPPLVSIHDEKNNLDAIDDDNGHIYLIRTREYRNSRQNIYKIGKTSQQGLGRYKQYSKDSMIEIHLHVRNYHFVESELIRLFKSRFIHRPDIGAEYFEGDPGQMMDLIYEYRFRESAETRPPIGTSCLKSQELDKVAVLECIFSYIWRHFHQIVTDLFLPEMDGIFLKHMMYLITGSPGNNLHSAISLPVSSDQVAPTVNLDKFRAELAKMYTPGIKKSVSCDQYRRYVAIHNLVTSAHPLIVQYETARRSLAQSDRYPEIKMSAAIEISSNVLDTYITRCYDYEYIKPEASKASETSGKRRTR